MEVVARRGDMAGDAAFESAAAEDLFFGADAFRVLYGTAWICLSIRNRDRAFVHVYAPSPIADTGYYDVEPYAGYFGPLVNTEDAGFIREALDAYSTYCREQGIVAELMRFNPWLANHRPFAKASATLKLIENKPILYLDLHPDEDKLFAQYEARCRNMIRAARRSGLTPAFQRPDDGDWDVFVRLYHATMDRVDAAGEWYFDEAFYDRLRLAPFTRLATVRAQGKILAAAVFLVAGACAYYFLSSCSEEAYEYKGVMNLLVHSAARECAASGASVLCLGGGRTSGRDDSLFMFKRSFSRTERLLPLGLFQHDPERLQWLYDSAAALEPDNAKVPLFLRYRCAERFSSGRMTVCEPKALV